MKDNYNVDQKYKVVSQLSPIDLVPDRNLVSKLNDVFYGKKVV
jgi:hypothetical protein